MIRNIRGNGRLEIEQLEQQGQSCAGREARQSGIADEGQVVSQDATEGRRLADLRRQYAGMQAKQERLVVACQRLQAKVDAFGGAKEAIETARPAAEEAAEGPWAEVTANANGAGSAAG